jgi:MFS family permease
MVGTAVEFYDFYIYATAVTLVFATLFFPKGNPAMAQMAAFATFGVAFFARPIGGIVFGHFGDRIGRKSTLVTSLLLMGGSTFLIAFLPSYLSWGWWAPAVLCVLRFGQGFGLGGEWGGATLLANENAPKGWEARYGSAPQLGSPVGFIFANGGMLLIVSWLSKEEFLTWGWRIPFFASVLMVAIGLWIRLKLTETPAFTEALKAHAPPKVPFGVMLKHHWHIGIFGAIAALPSFMVFYMMSVVALNYGTDPKVLGYSFKSFLMAEVAAIPMMALGIVLSGWLADTKLSPTKVLTIGAFLTMIAGALFPVMLVKDNIFSVWMFLTYMSLVMGLVYGPLAAFLPSLFPVSVRYSGVSYAFNLAAILGGALTPFAAKRLMDAGGLGYVGAYLASAGVVSLIGLALLAKRRA